jgi:hypothetical protein
MNWYIVPLALVMALSLFDAKAEWVTAEGTIRFGPDKSQTKACNEAELMAEKNALKSVVGEKISSEDNMVCSEMQDAAECILNRSTWSTIDGLVKGTKKLDEKTETVPGFDNYNKCTVSLKVDVGVAEGSPDPSFDLAVKLNQRTFRHGEQLIINLTPTKSMYINVFQFLPYQVSEKQITRFFPNSRDKQKIFYGKGTVPTHGDSCTPYCFKINFPIELRDEKNLIDEYLLVLGTKKPIKFLDEYSREEFNARLLEIPQSNRRIVRKSYNVVRPR